ncbi:MAG TPA: FliA/WhiG family RNA polymerase sigma factor [Gaiellaceae bacterium]|jgi:RNA polymerase sigma factor for flagellar operon FliA|nr:FliA/WhiG family RNA polymerase sigma factor [Gaiellaceae bacterium]
MNASSTAQRLSHLEAEKLWRAWTERNDKAARDRLILAYSPMVRYLASRKVRELPAQCELDDLVSNGLVALIEAIDRFDPRKGASFEQFAWTRVAGAIMDELRRQDWASRSVRRTGRKIEQERERFYAREGVMPTEAELAERVSLSTDELRGAIVDVDRADVLSLHSLTRSTEESSVEVIETVAEARHDSEPEETLLAEERMNVIRMAISGLSERECDVFALVHVHEMQGADIGQMLGVSESRVSQILTGVRGKLRDQLARYDETAANAAA